MADKSALLVVLITCNIFISGMIVQFILRISETLTIKGCI